MRRLVSALLLVAFVLPLVGCGEDKPADRPAVQGQDKVGKGTGAVPPPPPPPPPLPGK